MKTNIKTFQHKFSNGWLCTLRFDLTNPTPYLQNNFRMENQPPEICREFEQWIEVVMDEVLGSCTREQMRYFAIKGVNKVRDNIARG